MARAHSLAVLAGAAALAGLAVAVWRPDDPEPRPTPAPQPREAPRERPPIRAPLPRRADARPAAAPALPAVAPASGRDAIAQALRAPHAGDAPRRRAMLAALEESGPPDAARAAAASARLRRWHAALDPEIAGAIELGAIQCFRAGCAAEVAFATADASAMARDHLRRRPGDDRDDGGRVQTPATPRADGWLVADWISLVEE